MTLASKIESLLPRWMTLPDHAHWLDLAVAMGWLVDGMIEGVYTGFLAGLPGQNEFGPELGGFINVDALPLLGRDRGVVRGPAETPASYAARLRKWRQGWRTAGTGFGLLGELRGVLGPTPPRVRLVSAAGVWHTIEEDGTRKLHTPDGAGYAVSPLGVVTAISTPAHPWDWDGGDDWARVWPIIYAPTNPPLHGTGGVYGYGMRFYGTPNETLGTTATPAFVQMARGLFAQRKPAGISVPYIVVAFDEGSFDPETAGPYPAGGMPDGTWGHHGTVVDHAGVHARVDARLQTARDWKGVL
jgi:hypothetical protein